MFKFLSVCSGIEAASVAFAPLGWHAVGLAEIGAFPSAVLAHHYGSNMPGEELSGNGVPNFGDFTKIALLPPIVDVLCGGTPCQAFSVAGKRMSLDDARGNLTLAFTVLAHELAGSHGLRNVLWENVPGVLSTKDNAYGCFLGALVGGNGPIEPVAKPKQGKSNKFWKWRNAGTEVDDDGNEVSFEEGHITRWPSVGMVAGPFGRAAWRVFDAQYFSLAQRRARVFVVADFGNGADPAAVLFESKGMYRDSPPSRETGQGVTGTLNACTEGGGGLGTDFELGGGLVAAPTAYGRFVDSHQFADVFKGSSQDYETTTMIAHTLRGDGFDASEDGTGRGTPIVPVIAPTLVSEGDAHSGYRYEHGLVPIAVHPINLQVITRHKALGEGTGFGMADEGEPAFTLGANHTHGVAIAFDARQSDVLQYGDMSGPLDTDGHSIAVVFAPTVAPCLTGNYGKQPDNSDTSAGPMLVAHGPQWAVRRLTPKECERLQGFPDDYTRITWRGKPAEDCPDGPRYKALGNSWAVPCVRWIAERIDAQASCQGRCMTINNSPFSRVGARLVDQGYSVITVLPGSKRPGAYDKGRWWGDLEWNRFCLRRPTDIELGIWNTWPDAGVCVALGPASGNLVALDIDTDEGKIIAAIESVIDPSPVQKMGKKGRTLFYRSSGAVQSCAFNVLGNRVLDLLSNGKQSVLPPTIHPDTGRPYEWTTLATLEDTTVDRLPMLPDDIASRLGSVLAEHGYTAPVERPPVDGDGGIWREVNDAALRRLDDWVPALGIDAKRGHDGRYRGRAIWKQAENANVGFSKDGIKDWGADIGHTALDVVMLAHSSDFPTAEKWLRERLGFKELAPVKFTFRKAVEPVFVEVPKPTITANLPKFNPWDPEAVGGLLGITAEWIYSTSFVPSRELSMLAAIGIQAAFQGRRYVGPTGLGTTLYLIGLASTGSGKDGPLSGIQNLLDGGMRHWMGSGDIASDSVIEKRLRTRPSCIFALDEVGVLMQQNSSKGAATHISGRKKTLLELYSRGKIGGIWAGKDRAGDDVLSSDCPLYMPCLSIFGVSTPEEFFKGVTEQNLRDGLLNRLTVIHVPPCEKRKKFLALVDVPRSLLNAYDKALEDWRPDGKPLPRSYINATLKPILQRVDFANQEAGDRADRVWEWQEDYIRDLPGSDGYIRRGYEQALKIAMIRAVSSNYANPSITVEDIDFADAIVSKSVENLHKGMKDFMYGSEFEENYKLLLRHVDASPEGLTETQLTHRAGVGKIETRKLKEALTYLSDTGRWEKRKTGKRGVRYFSWGGRVMKEEED